MQLLVGSTKGLLSYERRRGGWALAAVHFQGLAVSMLFYDERNRHIWVGLAIKHWGPKLFLSTDLGQSWEEKSVPKYPRGSETKPGNAATLQLIWSAHYQSDKHRLWVGTEPGGLFYSDDHGETFHLNNALWEHPSREAYWFGGGRNNAGIHTILAHPDLKDQIYIGVSCGGVFHSTDGGESWHGRNNGLHADYLPNPLAEYGHDPHAMAICRSNPSVIWQQNHCGVFRSVNGGKNWKDLTAEDDFGRYGFPLVIDHVNPDRAWIIPAESDEQRVAKDLRLVVNHTKDGGHTWQKLTNGLPQENCFDLVFRHGFAKKDQTMTFGTTSGNLFFSKNEGEDWALISGFLPPIHSVILI